MFQIGDKVFYPSHGAGIIKSIEEREFRGKMEQYCSIHIPSSGMHVMLPLAKLSSAGVRSVVDLDTVQGMLSDYYAAEFDCELPWKQRYTANMEKVRTGEMEAGLQVVSDLSYRSQDKPLNSSEKQMLNEARRLIVSELAMVKDISDIQAAGLLELPSEKDESSYA